MNIKSFIKRVIEHERANPFVTYPWFLFRVTICRWRYRVKVRECRRKVRSGQKIKVLFLVSNCSKWKAQSLYAAMAKSEVFEPVLGVTFCDDELFLPAGKLQDRINNDCAFYDRLGDKWIMACDVEKRTVIDPRMFSPDIVFFPVPWGLLDSQNVWPVSKYALTCYIPYALECFDQIRRSRRFDFNHLAHFQQLMWLFVLASEDYARYTREPHYAFERAGAVRGLGHTALDPYVNLPPCKKNYTIFAPHFSFPWNGVVPIMNHATFQWSGKPILEYAKRHPELNWAFKPHPLLRGRLVENGFMTVKEVDAYYRAWEEIGVACYDGGYADLFKDSRALITDSGSFLLEYMAVGKPLIRLEPLDFNMKFSKVFKPLLDTFYTCRSTDEMFAAFRLVLEEGRDPRREVRQAAARVVGLFGQHAAENILNYLKEAFQCE